MRFRKQNSPFLLEGLNSIGTSLSGYSSVSGIPPYVLQRLGIEGPITNKVFVANVRDYNEIFISNKKLKFHLARFQM